MRVIRSLSRRFATPLVVATLCVSATVFAACSDASLQPGPDLAGDSVAFRTDAKAYTVTRGDRGYDGRISAVYVNRTSKPVYIANCNGSSAATLEKWQDGAWQPVYTPAMPLCLSVPMAVQPGAAHRFDLVLTNAFAGGSGATPPVAVVAGEYRAVWQGLIWDFLPDAEKSTQLPLELRLSNTFTIAPAN